MNLVLNGNFENETLNGWDIVGDSSAINLAGIKEMYVINVLCTIGIINHLM